MNINGVNKCRRRSLELLSYLRVSKLREFARRGPEWNRCPALRWDCRYHSVPGRGREADAKSLEDKTRVDQDYIRDKLKTI